MMDTTHTPQTTAQVVAILKRQYPASQWSCTEMRAGDYPELQPEHPEEVTLTFQRYSDDAEQRFVILDGVPEMS